VAVEVKLANEFKFSDSKRLGRGTSTASPRGLDYRLGKISRVINLQGFWLDCGCADGKYLNSLHELGVNSGVGLDIELSRVVVADQNTSHPSLSFICGISERLPFSNGEDH
jgi:2-polyprenyl-3-methyl-5-hydroxy-6-metoxy-1,4-benzoquinol methylase